MTRKRFCTNPPPTIGGKDCSELGPDHEKTSCQLVDCRGELEILSSYKYFTHIDRLHKGRRIGIKKYMRKP